jgi:elongation factor P
MENDTGEMYDIQEDKIDDIVDFLKDNLDCYIMKHNGNVLSIILPATISYTIESTVDGIK